MICVYDVGENHYDRLGSCVLTPIKGSHRQIAGGSYELTLEHPIDAGGKWAHLQNGAILKVPVPEETIEDAREGMAADIYRTVAEAELREEPSEPQQINYNAWNPANSYTVGSKVTCSGWNHRNWQCTFYDQTSPQTYVPPYNNNSWWKQIADYTSGSPVIVKLPAGETLYLVEAGEGWYQVITPYGVQGYIKADKVEFVKHVEPGEITSHVITEQLFRITEVDIDNEANKVTAKARHVSYDLNGILCEDMEISQANAAMAISRIAQGLMMDYPGAIATNLTDTAGTYTQSIKGRNGGFCLLDPDRGVLPAFGAMLKRDNWDVFVLKKKHTDRGYRIRYGKNAKGINWQRKVQDLVTRVVPVAKNEDGSNLYLPEKWVDSTHISEYPTVIMEWLRVDGQVGKDDGTGTDTVWTLENLYTEMRTKAGERFSVDKVDVPAEEVTVNFEQLGDTAEYPWMRERETILLYDKIQAIDERIGLRMDLYVTEIEYDIIRQKVTGVKLSNTDSYRERTVTGFNVQDNSITPRKLTDEVKDSFMASAVGVMPNYANSNTWKANTASSEGYVQKGEGNANKVWATNGDGEPGWRNAGSYTLPLAADGTRGGVQIGYTQSGKNYPVQLSGEKMFVNVPWTDHYAWDDITGKPSSFYTLPLAANGTRGGVQVGFSTSAADRNYAVQLSGEKMYVNVPWENTWRGIQDNLNSTSATDSLSANQGRLLNAQKVAKAGDTMTWTLNFNYASGENMTWAIVDHNTHNTATPGWSHGIKFRFAESTMEKWCAVAARATSAYANSQALDFYVQAARVATVTSGGFEPAATAAYDLGTSSLKWNNVYGNEFTGNAETARKLKTWEVGNRQYVSGDTHILQIGYIIGGGYRHVSLLITSAFWGNQHGSSDWLDFQFDTSNGGNLNFTASRRWLGGNYFRRFYTVKSGTNIYIYAYVNGGNSYGQWITSTVQDSANAFVSSYGFNMSISGQTEIPYLNPLTNLSINGNTLSGAKMDGSAVSVTIPTSGGTTPYTLPLAGNGTRGGVQIGYQQSGQNYPVQLSGEKMYVNVPWTDTNTWRPMTSNCTTVPTDTSTCLSGSAGYNLAHGHARDSRVKYFNLSPGAVTTFWINGANSGYVIIWRLGTANSYGIKFGTGTSIVNMMLTGTDYCGVTDNNMTVTIKNNNANYHLRGWVFNNTERAEQPDVTD